MKKLILLLLLLPSPLLADFQVTGVRSDFSMDDNEPRYRDVYVNMGTNQGIKEESQLDAFRVLTTVDEINQKIGRNITFRIARLKVIHAENDMAVARVLKMESPETTPIGTYTNVMTGDKVDVGRK